MLIPIKTKKELDIMRHNGRVLGAILQELKNATQPNMRAFDLEVLARKLIDKNKGKPSFLGFNNYPAALCVSVNEEIVHALPSKQKTIKRGDIISLDLGFYKNGFHADAALSFALGAVDSRTKKLLKITKEALDLAISIIKPGISLKTVSMLIQNTIERNGFFVIKELTGHGIGRQLHEDPYVLNYNSSREKGIILREGMTIAIEPMASLGTGAIKKGKDGFAYVTKDGSLSAHFEHTIAVTKKGAEILTAHKA